MEGARPPASSQAEPTRDELVAERARLQELQNTFVSIVSHELQTPVAIIKGYAGTLRRPDASWSPAVVQRIASTIEEECDRLTRLITDLLDLSRMTANKLEVIRSPVNLVKIVQAAVDACSPLAEERGISLALEQPEARLFVLGDEQRLIQSVANLTGNGIKFTRPHGSVVVRVQRLEPDTVVVTVSDTGIGMTPEVLERLFEPFWQADSSKSREHGGLGLGLAITKHLIDEHDGSIQATSAGPGLGSTFTIRLPLLDVGAAGGDAPRRRAGPPARAPAAAPAGRRSA